jgi:alpha-glucosidase (family GH31 glycosyl hydrolase)
MDWHWTDVLDRFGKDAKPGKPRSKEEVVFNTLMPGWTGYTWNTELFPDHRELLSWLHEKGFKVPLNVHPSQGVRFFEDAYEAMCRQLGKDPASRELIPFDPADPEFMAAYFEVLHRPLEEEGVDFWWLDWQQGQSTNIPGLDPLWALNHYHTRDAARDGRRPLILSRYAGLGSHRYPLGFSGDTIVSWKSLDFQPYFTNTAANAGYTWWSHDIGGHMRGIQDDELYLRWLQYGVFSPINRLHSSNSDFMGKEPWKRSWAVEKISEEFLRLRHRLIPYLYTANYETHTAAMPICAPLYYRHDGEDAYKAKNEYYFGSQLLVSPITQPADKRLNLASASTWLPEGRWTDIFNGRIYQGGRWVNLYRDLDSIPVLAKEGAIIPMYRSGSTNDLSLNQPLEIHLWRGNGRFELYEDDGETMAYQDGRCAITTFTLEEVGSTLRLTVTPPADSHGLLPEKRQMFLKFRDVEAEELEIWVGSQPVTVELTDIRIRRNLPKEELRSTLLTRVQAGNDWKNRHFYKQIPGFLRDALAELDALWYPEA